MPDQYVFWLLCHWRYTWRLLHANQCIFTKCPCNKLLKNLIWRNLTTAYKTGSLTKMWQLVYKKFLTIQSVGVQWHFSAAAFEVAATYSHRSGPWWRKYRQLLPKGLAREGSSLFLPRSGIRKLNSQNSKVLKLQSRIHFYSSVHYFSEDIYYFLKRIS